MGKSTLLLLKAGFQRRRWVWAWKGDGSVHAVLVWQGGGSRFALQSQGKKPGMVVCAYALLLGRRQVNPCGGLGSQPT